MVNSSSSDSREREEHMQKEITRLNKILQYNLKIYERTLGEKGKELEKARTESNELKDRLKRAEKKLSDFEREIEKLKKALAESEKAEELRKVVEEKEENIEK
ncbi:MAG: hypothetical protein ACE5NL_02620, partial [Candidatus Hydrothermarchaeaceae archaeon]